MVKRRKRAVIVVKPTNACNLRCKYCYAESGEGKLMSFETLKNMISKFQEFYDDVEYIWHGGEPLLVGKDFYKKVVELEEKNLKSNQEIINGIQTNGTLLTEDLLDFFIENNFNIGFSLDGPRALNDQTRVYLDGRGSFDDIMGSINLTKRKGKEVGSICVLNKYSINHIDEIYDFFKESKIGLKLNPIFPEGRAKDSDLCISSKEYGETLIKLFDRWFYEDKLYSMSQLEDFVEMILFRKSIGCQFQKSCQNVYYSIDANGDVYPCGRFVGLKNFLYGNINKNNIKELDNCPIRKKLKKRKVKECSPCDYYNLCHSGCIHNAYLAYGDINKKDPFCVAYKMLFKHVEESINKELSKTN